MKLQGNIPVIPTPFLNGAIEYDGLDRLLEHTVEAVDGYVVCGSTGEAPALTCKERIDIVRFLAQRMPAGKELVVKHPDQKQTGQTRKAEPDLLDPEQNLPAQRGRNFHDHVSDDRSGDPAIIRVMKSLAHFLTLLVVVKYPPEQSDRDAELN